MIRIGLFTLEETSSTRAENFFDPILNGLGGERL